MENKEMVTQTKNVIEPEPQKEEIAYKGAEVAMTVMIDEYSKELERKTILENKVVTILTIQMGMLTLLIPMIPFEKIQAFFRKGCGIGFAITILSVMMLVVALVVMSVSFGLLISAIKIQVYKKVDIMKLCSEDKLQQNGDVAAASLCIHYRDITIQNEQQNNNKGRKFQTALPLSICSFVLLTISVIMIKLL